MGDLVELAEILYKMDDQINTMLDWCQAHKDDGIFETEAGKNLMHHMGGITKQHTLAMISVAIVSLEKELMKSTVNVTVYEDSQE